MGIAVLFAGLTSPATAGDFGALIVLVIGTILFGWSLFRSQALKAWRSAAEGYKEQLNEVTIRLRNTETNAATLARRVQELEALPDYADVLVSIKGIQTDLRRIADAVET